MKLNQALAYGLFSFWVASSLGGAVENSVIPQIERFENVNLLQTHRYSKNQFLEMASILERKPESIRLATYNMLFNLYDQNLDEVNRWPQRLSRIVELIGEMQPDIMGVQELYSNQLKDLLPMIEDTYAFYAKACEDGELNGIFYRKDRFEVVDHKIWYMTATPKVSSSETLTMIQLRDVKTGKCLAVFNTHLSFSKVDKREFQARFIAKRIEWFADKMPVILTGDMNTFPHRLDLQKLPFYDGDYIDRILTKKHLRDSIDISLLGHLGPLSTFSNAADGVVPFTGTGTPGVFLDHIYVSKEVNVIIHAVQPGTVNGHFPSDHLPVLIDFILD